MAVLVEISGCAGDNAARVNGVYEPTAERRRERVVYRKWGDGATWLSMTSDGWMVQKTASKAADSTAGWFDCASTGALSKAQSPLDVPLGAWQIHVGGQWAHQAGTRMERA